MEKKTFYIIGKHSVEEALKNTKRKVHKLYLTETSKKNINKRLNNHNLLKNIKIFFKSKRELDNLCGKDDINHQGYIAEVEELDQIKLKDYLKRKDAIKNINFIVLDEVTDPRNIGSILRSAASFNIDGIIVKERSFPMTSKVLYKSASGAAEHVNIFTVSNINTILRFLKDKGFWVSAFDNNANKDFTENEWEGKNALVFGSEGFGLKKNTLSNADYKFKIQIDSSMESLNISNAVAVVAHHINFKLKTKKT